MTGLTADWPNYWQIALAILSLGISVTTSGHAILWKRDYRSALIWVSLIWFLPLIGSFLYLIFGINRIQRRAALLRSDELSVSASPSVRPCPAHLVEQRLEQSKSDTDLCAIAKSIESISQRPLLPGNQIKTLQNGDEAFPAMLKAIRNATRSITLSTYIFDLDRTGAQFAAELAKARRRGVQTRILIDSTGARYSWPPITDRLTQLKVPYARFLPSSHLTKPFTLNLHNHRKIMVVDGKIGFTGGINIRHANVLAAHPKRPIRDLHFKLGGPVVAHLQEAFASDWAYATRERLVGDQWFPKLRQQGSVLARGITDGPDEDLDKLIWSLIAALNAATESVWIITPYFLPEAQLIAALNAAALRGVQVNILIPSKNNLPFMNWAMSAMLWQIVQRGCRVFATAPPFDHTKLMIVDDCWSMIGSANWDARSLRLNFELNVECYCPKLATQLRQHAESKLATAHLITLTQLENRSLLIKLRDGITRLLSPFL